MTPEKQVIGLVHNEPIPQGQANWQSSLDIMAQVEAIENSLAELGHGSVRIPFTRDLGRFIRHMQEVRPSLVFNLCESVDDNPLFVAHPAAVLELLNIPFTGSPSSALTTTTDKHLLKLILQAVGLNTPTALYYSGEETVDCSNLRFPVIIKPQFQDASIGIDQESVVADPSRLPAALTDFHAAYGPLVVEEYIDGREFNISLLGITKPEVMPVAEIDFSGFPDDLYKIVGYRAKWEPTSVEYQESKRAFPALPETLRQQMAAVSTHCYRLLGLQDYGRVDLRLDRNGKIYILEINANPCLSPDAGFPAAVMKSGLDYTAMVEKIISFAFGRNL